MLAVVAAILLVVAKGDTQALIPVFAIGVFVGFTLSQAGMVRHWHEQHADGWLGRAFINGLGAVLTTAALAIELVSKFTEGAWLVVIVVPLLVLMFDRIHRPYDRIGGAARAGPGAPAAAADELARGGAGGGMSRLTAEAVSAALSIGDEVLAVTVCFADPEDEQADAEFPGADGRPGTRTCRWSRCARRAARSRRRWSSTCASSRPRTGTTGWSC